MSKPPRWLPFALLLAAFALFAALGGLDLVSLDGLASRFAELRAAAAANRPLALALFVAGYAALVSTAVFPAAFVLTFAGGALFGPVAGALASIAGVTIGGTVAFLAARRALAGAVVARLGPRAEQLRAGIERDGLAFLIVLRLTPLLPFWLVTLTAAAAALRPRDYIAGTAIGVFPACFVFAGLGASAGATMAAGGALSARAMATDPKLIAPMAALAVLSAAGLALRLWGRRRRR